MKKDIPVYDIKSVSGKPESSFLVSRFSPYYETHHNLRHAHRHNFYHLLLFTEGAGSHSIDFEHFPVKPYQIYFMIPGQVHHWNFDGGVDGYVVNFSDDFFQSFFLDGDFLDDFRFFRGRATDSVLDVPVGLQGKVIGLFQDILNEETEGRKNKANMQRLQLMQLFILLSRLESPEGREVSSSYGYTLLGNFQKLVGQKYKEFKLPKEYAALMYITPNHLNKLCNDLLGISAGDVIRNHIILEAKRLLINPELTISEISGLLNFADNSYFTKSFKRHSGVTPEQFRKQLLNHE